MLEAMLANLTPAQGTRLMKSVIDVTTAAQEKWGVTPDLSEVVELPQVKAATYDEHVADIDNCLYLLERQAPTVIRHIAAAESAQVAEEAAEGDFRDTGVVSESDMENVPAHLRYHLRVGMTADEIGGKTSATLGMALVRALAKQPAEPSSVTVDDIREEQAEIRAEADRKEQAKRTEKGDDPAVNGSAHLNTHRHSVPPHEYFDAATARMNEARKAAK